MINGASYVVVSEKVLAQAVDQLVKVAEPGPSTDSTTMSSSTATTQAVDVSGTTVDVLGASGRAGEAGAAAAWLRSLGIAVGTTGDDSANVTERSAIEYPQGMLAEAKRVSRVCGVDRVQQGTVGRVTLRLGKDFKLPPQFALPPSPDTIPDSKLWKQTAAEAPFAVQAPSYLPSRYSWTSKMPENQPVYDIKVGGGTKPAFRMLYVLNSNEDQVMGITETSWLGAPAASKGLTVAHAGTVFTVVRNDQKVERVWWKADGVLYWVSNTLSHTLDQDEMVKIAVSMISIPAR